MFPKRRDVLDADTLPGSTPRRWKVSPDLQGEALIGLLCAATLLVGLVLASLVTGGYTSAGQRWLLLFSALLVLGLIILAPAEHLRSAIRTPVAWVLVLLAIWAAASAIWTIGAAGDAIRWAAVILDYAVMALCGVVLSRWLGVRVLAAVLALVSVLEGAIGVWALLAHHIPDAVLEGGWRPGGTFQYSPALALLELSSLPYALSLACADSRRRSGAGALMLIVAGITFGTEQSRAPLAIAAGVIVFLALKTDPAVLPRPRMTAGVALVCLTAVGADLLLGRAGLSDRPNGAATYVVTIGGTLAIAAAWPWLRRLVPPLPRARTWLLAGAVVVAVALVWVLVGHTGDLTSTSGGLDHSRFSYWTSAYDAWRFHPWVGSGAETFFASASFFQLGNPLMTLYAHNLPLELAAELGIVGFLLGVGIYLFVGRDVVRWLVRPAAAAPDAWLLAPAAGAFLIQNLFDWPWHFAALGAMWALSAGGLSAQVRGRGARGWGHAVRRAVRRPAEGYFRKPS